MDKDKRPGRMGSTRWTCQTRWAGPAQPCCWWSPSSPFLLINFYSVDQYLISPCFVGLTLISAVHNCFYCCSEKTVLKVLISPLSFFSCGKNRLKVEQPFLFCSSSKLFCVIWKKAIPGLEFGQLFVWYLLNGATSQQKWPLLSPTCLPRKLFSLARANNGRLSPFRAVLGDLVRSKRQFKRN